MSRLPSFSLDELAPPTSSKKKLPSFSLDDLAPPLPVSSPTLPKRDVFSKASPTTPATPARTQMSDAERMRQMDEAAAGATVPGLSGGGFMLPNADATTALPPYEPIVKAPNFNASRIDYTGEARTKLMTNREKHGDDIGGYDPFLREGTAQLMHDAYAPGQKADEWTVKNAPQIMGYEKPPKNARPEDGWISVTNRKAAEWGLLPGTKEQYDSKSERWYPLRGFDAKMASADATKAYAKNYFAENFGIPTVTMGPYQAFVKFGNLAVRGVDGDTADQINRNLDAISEEADIAAGRSTLKRYIRGGTESIATVLLTRGVAGGTTKAIAGAEAVGAASAAAQIATPIVFSAESANAALTEARDAGLKDADAKNFALTSGAIEGGIMGIFQLVGMGGLETTLLKGVGAKTFRELGKQFGVSLFKEELPEELLTTAADQVARRMFGVNPADQLNPDGTVWSKEHGFSPIAQTYIDTIGQTAVAMGLAHGPSAAKIALTKPGLPNATPAPTPPEATPDAPAAELPAQDPTELPAQATAQEPEASPPKKMRPMPVGAAVQEWATENPEVAAPLIAAAKANQPFSQKLFTREVGLYRGNAEERAAFAKSLASLPDAPVAEQDSGPTTQQPIAEPIPPQPETPNEAARPQPETAVPPAAPAAIEAPAETAVAAAPVSKFPFEKKVEIQRAVKQQFGESIEFVEPDERHADAIAFLSSRGIMPRFYKSKSDINRPVVGFEMEGAVYLNAQATKGNEFWAAVGHEYAHASGADQRLGDLPEEVLADARKEYARSVNPRYKKYLIENPDAWTREAVAQYVGKLMADPSFRAKVEGKDPTLWQKIWQAIRSIVGNYQPNDPAAKRVLEELTIKQATEDVRRANRKPLPPQFAGLSDADLAKVLVDFGALKKDPFAKKVETPPREVMEDMLNEELAGLEGIGESNPVEGVTNQGMSEAVAEPPAASQQAEPVAPSIADDSGAVQPEAASNGPLEPMEAEAVDSSQTETPASTDPSQPAKKRKLNKAEREAAAIDEQLRAEAVRFSDIPAEQDGFVDMVNELWQAKHDAHLEREAAKKAVRQRMGKAIGLHLRRVENGGKDWKSIPGFDVTATDIANNPDFSSLGIDPSDAPGQLFAILREGVLDPPSKLSDTFTSAAADAIRSVRDYQKETDNGYPAEWDDIADEGGDVGGIEGGRPAVGQADQGRVSDGLAGVREEGVRPSEPAKGQAEDAFGLKREPAKRVVGEKFDNAPGEQGRMFSGMDALPGQGDLFDDVDKPSETIEWKPGDQGVAASAATPHGMDATVEYSGIDPLGIGGIKDVPKWSGSPKPSQPAPPQDGGTPAESAPLPEGATSIKNAVVDQERASRGLPPADEVGRRSFGTVWDEVRKAIAADPSIPEKLQAQLMANPRAVTDTEDAILLHRQITLQSEHSEAMNALTAARDANNADAIADAETRVGVASDRLLELYNVNKSVGTETGRGLNARKMLAKEDYTLSAMIVARRAANGGSELTPEQNEEVRQLYSRIEKLQKAYDEYVTSAEEKLRAAQADLAIAEMARAEKAAKKSAPAPPTSKGYGSRNRLVKKDTYQKVLEELKTTTFAFPALPIDKFIIVGTYHLEAGARSFAEFSARMIGDIGERVRPALQEVYDQALAGIRANDRESLKGKIKEKVDAGAERSELSALIQKLARQFVADGITERGALVNAVHDVIKDIAPNMTPRDTMDAISGYGDFKQLSKDEISAKLRDLKGQMQQVGKIEDMQGGKAPKKTGVERRSPSDEERRLLKEVNELKKKGGYVVTDPATQLRTALNAIKTRLKNQITDLAEAIESHTQIGPRKKNDVAYDAEAEAMRKNRDTLKEEYDAIFGKQGLSDAQRIKNAEAAGERAIARLNEQLKDARGFQFMRPKPERPDVPRSARLDAIRAQQEAIKAEIEELRAIAFPGRTPEERALKAFKSRTARQIAELTKKTAAGDFSKRKSTEYKLDDHGRNLRHGLDIARRQWHEALFKDALARRSVGQKVFQGGAEVVNTARAIMTSFDLSAVLRQGGFIVIGHPVRAMRAMGDMFRALKSDKGQFDAEQDILTRDNYPLYRRAGLFLSERSQGLAQMEEAYMSRWAEKIPGVAASQRAYSAFLNRLRADSFDAMAATLTGGERAPTNNEARIIANAVNVFTGRGSLGMKENALVGLNTFFFAPRFVASRFQTLLGQPIYHGVLSGKADFKDSAKVRAIVASEYARYLTGLGVIFGLAAMAGMGPEDDPESSDFGKIIVGNTRIDLLSGLSQATVLLSRLVSGKATDKFGDTNEINRADAVGRFLRTKLSPAFGSGWNLLSGKNIQGDPATLSSEVQHAVVPLAVGDIKKAIDDNGVPAGTAIGLVATFGASIQTHDAETKEEKDKRLGSVIYAATDPKPLRKNYKTDEAYLEAKQSHDASMAKAMAKIERLKLDPVEMKRLLATEAKRRGFSRNPFDERSEGPAVYSAFGKRLLALSAIAKKKK